MEIRVLEVTDAMQYRTLRLKALQTDPEAFGSDYQQEAAYPIEKFAERTTETEHRFAVGAFESGILISVASFRRETNRKTQHKGTLYGMYCEEDLRGSKVAKQVLHALLEKAAAISGLTSINLIVLSENKRAIEFYRAFGFIRYGTEPNALYDGQRYYNEDLMQLTL